MLRSALPILMVLALARPLHADEPPGDEPMPAAQPAPAAPQAGASPTAPASAAQPAPAAPAAQPAAAATLEEEIIPNPPKKYAIGFLGGAAGTLAIAAILGGVALGKSDEQSGNPSSPPLYTRDLQDSGNTGRALATTSYVFLAVGLGLAVTDVVLWYETYRKPRTMKRSTEGAKP